MTAVALTRPRLSMVPPAGSTRIMPGAPRKSAATWNCAPNRAKGPK
ncbi:MAG: hypothetical protein R2838_09450 [Caldilineaceae bacterium]